MSDLPSKMRFLQEVLGKHFSKEVVVVDATNEPWDPGPVESVRRPLMHQAWRDIAFLHWPYAPSVVQRLVPSNLEVETFEGAAWVGLTPFKLAGVRGPFGPPVPWLSFSAETNVRTYVRDRRGRSGVWFLSLDVARAPMAVAGRVAYRLPYMWSRMTVERSGSTMHYVGRRRIGGQAATYDVHVSPKRPLSEDGTTTFARFLTARYALFTRYGRHIVRTRVEHEPWPLWDAAAVDVKESLLEAAGLPAPKAKPVVHWSRGVSVRIAAPDRSTP